MVRFVDIVLSEEQELLYRAAVDFARSAMTPASLRDLEGGDQGFDPAVWRKMAELGWAGLPFAPEQGGAGLGVFELALVIEACCRAALPSPLFSTVVEAGLLLQESGSAEHRDAWLPRIAAGTAVLTTAVHEPVAGYTAAAIQSPVVSGPGGYRIDGTKLFVRDAALAEAIIWVARSGPAPEEITLLFLPRDTGGLRLRRMPAAGGEPLCEVQCEGVTVPAAAVVGEAGHGWPLVERMLRRGACLKAAELVGIGQAALDMTVAYARDRVQFGRPIGAFQAVHHHCTDMYRDLVGCRLLAYQAASALSDGGDAQREVAIAKAKASEAVPGITRMAHQVHGGVAYYTDYPLGLYTDRALAAASAYGDAAFHRRQLGRLLREDLLRIRRDQGVAFPAGHLQPGWRT